MDTAIRKALSSWFGGLNQANVQATSPATKIYNCIAWAAGDYTRWWEPDPAGKHFWPITATRAFTIEAYCEAMQHVGYRHAADLTLETGIEKVAIFNNGPFSFHAARQLANGRWTSKLGPNIDLDHEIQEIEGITYGFVKRVMQRPRRPAPMIK